MHDRAAQRPPDGLPGLDPSWSRLVEIIDDVGHRRALHLLDHGARDAPTTIVCVHGNPTWSYLWRRLVGQGGAERRVVAPDHLGMGFSERPVGLRRLGRRIEDLDRLLAEVVPEGDVVLVAHDWGGPIALGWAARHLDRLRGVVLANTAVHQPPHQRAPALIRLVRTSGLSTLVTRRTSAFVDGTLRVAGHVEDPEVRRAYRAPYLSAVRRRAIEGFVADIPLGASHPSAACLDEVAASLDDLTDVPVLIAWGGRDPVFGDAHLADLRRRLPHADVSRHDDAGHLLPEETALHDTVLRWIDTAVTPAPGAESTGRGRRGGPAGGAGHPRPRGTTGNSGPSERRRSLWQGLERRANDHDPAIVSLVDGRRATFAELAHDTQRLAAGLADHGVRPGDRVALAIPPGPALVTAVYACWRAGAVIVVADAGLGPRGMTVALRSAAADHLIGVGRALVAARALGWPGRPILAGRAALGGDRRRPGPWRRWGPVHVDELMAKGAGTPLPEAPAPGDDAAVLFTSGATGPAKGVVYRHAQLEAQRDVLARTYRIGPDDRLVAAFAPFALYGPALGIGCAIPDCDVTAPADLSAAGLAEAIEAIDATMVFASPAALGNVVDTAPDAEGRLDRAGSRVRLVLSAGAPVPAGVLGEVVDLLGGRAEARTPYGMTEVLPVTDVDLGELHPARGAELRRARGDQVPAQLDGLGDGICVGRAVTGVEVAVAPLSADGRPGDRLVTEPGVTGELCVRADHVRDRYDVRWPIDDASWLDGHHRSGDVGHLDSAGRWWIEGRLAHVAVTSSGPVTPVGPERVVCEVIGCRRTAVVGVGPPGAAVLVVVVETDGARSRGEDRAASTGGATGRPRGRVMTGRVGVATSSAWRERPGPGPVADEETTTAVRAALADRWPPVAAVLRVDGLPVDVRHQSKIDRLAVTRWATAVLGGGPADVRP